MVAGGASGVVAVRGSGDGDDVVVVVLLCFRRFGGGERSGSKSKADPV